MNRIKSLFNRECSYTTFTLVLAIYFATIVNLPIYKELFSIISHLDSVKLRFVIPAPMLSPRATGKLPVHLIQSSLG
ncbi:hypothetical protein K6U70_11150 [Vibrio vulnificus]|uniref:hypothetical protein n=1 Tax=Vibrio vulnificus TaxID=672 RepID=UPI001EEC1CB3|nr:hypothetical protein [Vibrio vulnificus]MCG6272680.1 hypothetical protein [Vibrio vulnificus]